jgi:hypothetical protein
LLPAAKSNSELPSPRWQTQLPEGVAESYGPWVIEYAETYLGITLDLWQKKAINRALAHYPDGALVHRMYLISTARQNGKTALVRALIGAALTAAWELPWSNIAGIAHDRKQAQLPYRAVRNDLQELRRRVGGLGNGGLALTMYMGLRSAMHGRLREYHTFSGEARDALRGESVDLGVFDDVRTQRNYETWAALEPTTTARPQPLIVPISTAGDDRSVLLRDWWERGRRIIEGQEPAHGFGMTWYAADDELADTAHDSPEFLQALLQANPSAAEGRIGTDVLLAGVAAAAGPAMVRGERLNLWSDAADEWLPPGLWRQREAPQPVEPIRVVLGVEAVPSWRRCTVTVALLTDSGAWAGIAGELESSYTENSSIDPRDLQGLLEELCRKWSPAAIACSGSAAAIPYVQAAGLATDTLVYAMTPRQVRSASQLLRSELIGGRLNHGPDALLSQQVRATRIRGELDGGDWYLSIHDSLGEIDAIRALAWAAWGAIAPPEPVEVPQVFV